MFTGECVIHEQSCPLFELGTFCLEKCPKYAIFYCIRQKFSKTEDNELNRYSSFKTTNYMCIHRPTDLVAASTQKAFFDKITERSGQLLRRRHL